LELKLGLIVELNFGFRSVGRVWDIDVAGQNALMKRSNTSECIVNMAELAD
jgi:hypothetical protein